MGHHRVGHPTEWITFPRHHDLPTQIIQLESIALSSSDTSLGTRQVCVEYHGHVERSDQGQRRSQSSCVCLENSAGSCSPYFALKMASCCGTHGLTQSVCTAPFTPRSGQGVYIGPCQISHSRIRSDQQQQCVQLTNVCPNPCPRALS